MKYFLYILCFILLCCNSSQQDVDREKESQQSAIDDIEILTKPIPLLDPSIISVIDSLKSINNHPFKEKFIFACEYLFDYSSLHFETKDLSTSFLQNAVTIERLNANFLVIIEYEKWSKIGNSQKLFLLDKQLNVLSEGSIQGNKYLNGSIQIVDWNNDTKKEILYKEHSPSSSIPYISTFEEIYHFTDDLKFEQIFHLETQLRNCSNQKAGELIERHYKFNNQQKIQVNETTYSFDCADFSWDEEIKKKRQITSKEYFMYFNETERCFMSK